jgi:hypothetical protein
VILCVTSCNSSSFAFFAYVFAALREIKGMKKIKISRIRQLGEQIIADVTKYYYKILRKSLSD